jgi:hypothetical protein
VILSANMARVLNRAVKRAEASLRRLTIPSQSPDSRGASAGRRCRSQFHTYWPRRRKPPALHIETGIWTSKNKSRHLSRLAGLSLPALIYLKNGPNHKKDPAGAATRGGVFHQTPRTSPGCATAHEERPPNPNSRSERDARLLDQRLTAAKIASRCDWQNAVAFVEAK